MGALAHLPVADLDVGDWPVGVVCASADGVVLRCNETAMALMPGLVRQTNLFGLIGGTAPGLRAAAVALGAGQSLRQPMDLVDGRRLRLSLMRRADGAFTVLIDDESAQAQAESEASRAAARLACIVDGLENAAVFTLDRDGRVAAWSASAQRFEGLSAARAEGMALDVLLSRCNLDAAAPALLEAARETGVGRHEGRRFGRACGLRWTSITVRAVRLSDGAIDGFVVTIQDGAQDTRRADELRRLAETDPLTGLLNRRALHETAAAACIALRGSGQSVSVIAVDIDRFKALNDARGHAAGDGALRALADAARAGIRAGDLIGRLGGDEFAIVLPKADAAGAMRLAERLRRTIEDLPLPGPMTASFGVAASAAASESFDETLARADVALYAAKRRGRNRTLLA